MLESLKANLATISTDCMTSAADHETTAKARAEELRVIAEAKKVIEDSVGGAASKVYGFFQLQQSSNVQSRLDLSNLEVVVALKKLAKEQHSAALAQLASRVSAISRFGGSNSEDIFAKIKGAVGRLTLGAFHWMVDKTLEGS